MLSLSAASDSPDQPQQPQNSRGDIWECRFLSDAHLRFHVCMLVPCSCKQHPKPELYGIQICDPSWVFWAASQTLSCVVHTSPRSEAGVHPALKVARLWNAHVLPLSLIDHLDSTESHCKYSCVLYVQAMTTACGAHTQYLE